VAGVNIEDGRADGSLRDTAAHSAIVASVKSAAPSLFVNARTDTAWLGAGGIEVTVDRLKAYVDAGADGVFVPGLNESQEIDRVVAATPAPLNVLISENGPTPLELAELGVARISFGSWLFRAALASAVDALQAARDGSALADVRTMTYDEVQALASRP
jgi:2-methylisocitrate lyase-like PEP mutase family enzyme